MMIMMMNNKNNKLATVALMLVSAAVTAVNTDPVDKALWKAFEEYEAREERVVPMLMHEFADECGAAANLPIRADSASLLQEQNVPGAGVDGIDNFKPFKRVLKDGFFSIQCTKDYMYYHGDKFGDNKHDYKLGFVNVSIVHYDAFIVKEDQEEMTQRKCFEFCRTVPNMGFFGLVNGRNCYCTPYYTPMESDDSQCDAVCEGDNTLRCGGESKSSIFAMHMCDSTKDDLGESTAEAKELTKLMKSQATDAAGLAEDMQTMGVALQKTFGAVGDSSATGLAQDAKVFAGPLLHKSEDVTAAARKLEDLTSSASRLAGKDFGNANKKRFASSNTIEAAESLMEQIDESVASSSALVAELHTLRSLAVGRVMDDDGHAFVDDDGRGYEWTTGPGSDGRNGRVFVRCGFKEAMAGLPEAMKTACADQCWFKGGECKIESVWYPKEGAKVTSVEAGYWKSAHPAIFRIFVDLGFVKLAPPDPEIFKRQYYPVMHFVDEAFEKVPATCSGSRVAKPIVGCSADMCAAACDANIHSCVGFQYFQDNGGSKNAKSLCFLLSDFETGFYYTGCGKSFLQAEASSLDARCYAKLSKFEGTTLKPNPSGKCPGCFKKLTKADRCYK